MVFVTVQKPSLLSAPRSVSSVSLCVAQSHRFGSCTDDLSFPLPSVFILNPCLNSFSPNQKRKLKQETLTFLPPPQELPPSVALRHYHRRLVVRASSSFKNCSFFFLELGASVPGISSAPSRSCRRPSGAQSPSSSSGRRRFFQPTTVF
ncbi:uncharacterized protein DS421_1g27610 [Arachis hypogaea]|nr:uncharacterized protein DS421_1g27610 [Arachis hypogaea]